MAPDGLFGLQREGEILLLDLLRQRPRRVEQLLSIVLDGEPMEPLGLCAVPDETGPLLCVAQARGARVPFCLVDAVAGMGDFTRMNRWDRLRRWARRWLEVTQEVGRPGWFVVLVKSEIVERRLWCRPWHLPYGVVLQPLVINLRHHVKPLGSERHPELAPLAVWTMRHYPELELVPVVTRALALSRHLPPPLAEQQTTAILRLLPEDIRTWGESFAHRCTAG